MASVLSFPPYDAWSVLRLDPAKRLAGHRVVLLVCHDDQDTEKIADDHRHRVTTDSLGGFSTQRSQSLKICEGLVILLGTRVHRQQRVSHVIDEQVQAFWFGRIEQLEHDILSSVPL